MSILDIALEILRDELPPEVSVNTWNPDPDNRTYPMVHLRRLGGRNSDHRNFITFPVLEITVYTNDMLETAEQLLDQVLDILNDAVEKQTVTSHGWIHSFFITFEAGQFDAQFDGAFRMQALAQFGARRPT